MGAEMEEYPPPRNLSDIVPKLDKFMVKALQDEGKGSAKDIDSDWATITDIIYWNFCPKTRKIKNMVRTKSLKISPSLKIGKIP
jgi:hypothetical protein